MRSKFSYSLVTTGAAVAVALMLSVGCTSKPARSDEPPAAASGANSAAVADKDITTDPQGSDSGRIAGLSTVYFEYDQAKLTSETRQKLAENATWIKNHPAYTVQVEGHTDSRGSVEYNLALGERRAKSVKSYLESLGVDAKHITIISYGKEKPIDPSDSESAWAKNRRANFVPLQ